MDASRCLVTVKFVDLSIPRVCNGGRQMEDWRSGAHSCVRMTGQRWLSLPPVLILILRTRLGPGPGLTSRQFPAQSTLRVKFSLKETESEPRRARAKQSRATACCLSVPDWLRLCSGQKSDCAQLLALPLPVCALQAGLTLMPGLTRLLKIQVRCLHAKQPS